MMKISIDIDLSADEAREILGLPNVRRVQDQWIEKVGERIFKDAENFTPDKILASWISGTAPNTDMLAGLMNTFMQGASKSK